MGMFHITTKCQIFLQADPAGEVSHQVVPIPDLAVRWRAAADPGWAGANFTVTDILRATVLRETCKTDFFDLYARMKAQCTGARWKCGEEGSFGDGVTLGN